MCVGDGESLKPSLVGERTACPGVVARLKCCGGSRVPLPETKPALLERSFGIVQGEVRTPGVEGGGLLTRGFPMVVGPLPLAKFRSSLPTNPLVSFALRCFGAVLTDCTLPATRSGPRRSSELGMLRHPSSEARRAESVRNARSRSTKELRRAEPARDRAPSSSLLCLRPLLVLRCGKDEPPPPPPPFIAME